MPNDPMRFYLRELAAIPPLTKREETDLLRHLHTQDELAESASKRLIEGNLSLVVSIARLHFSGRIQMLDLIQSGNQGLFLAVETSTGNSSGDFSVHAANCIEAAILKAIDESRSPNK